MRKKNIYKLPVIRQSFVLESNFSPSEEEEKKKLIENVSKESYQKGRDDALKDNQENVKLLCQSLQKAIEDLKHERDDIWDKCEKEIIKLILATAKKAVYEEISRNSSKIIESIVRDALNKVKENKILSVYVNPEDVEKLKAMKIAGLTVDGEECEMISDADISRGGCRVVTDCGGVDARVETRWGEIASAFGEHNSETEGMECQE
ncbi:MAG: FliH/SctL family protein [Candidatus Scalindua sp.]